MARFARWLLMALAMPAVAFAAGTPVEGSMLVTGTITVNPDGGVRAYTVQGLDKLPSAVRQIIQTTVSRWQFVPIMADGKAVTAKAGMSLRIVADMVDAQHATISIAGAAFGCDARPKSNLPGECPAGTAVHYVHRDPPSYPMNALQARVGGEVFLVLQIGRDGRVSQAAVRQVNLYSVTDWPAHYRKVLANATLRAATNGNSVFRRRVRMPQRTIGLCRCRSITRSGPVVPHPPIVTANGTRISRGRCRTFPGLTRTFRARPALVPTRSPVEGCLSRTRGSS